MNDSILDLAHLDLHFGNFSVDVASGTITLFDFDDCAYGWYMMDVAMPLFDVLVLCPDADKEAFAAHFLNHYLRGYAAAKHLSAFWLGQLPHFLKLVEVGVYTQVYRADDSQDADSWIGRFMAGRRERIENDVPYVNPRAEALLQAPFDHHRLLPYHLNSQTPDSRRDEWFGRWWHS